MKVTIKGRIWTISRLTPKKFLEAYPQYPGVLGVTIYDHDTGYRLIVFHGTPSYSTIKHEVMHAFLSTRQFKGHSYGEIEEQVCDEVGNNLERIARVAKKIRSQYS